MFTEELKIAVVQYVLEGHTRKETSEKFCVSCTPIEKWVNLYKLHGTEGLASRNLVGRQKGFDGEFRLKVLQYKQEHHLFSYIVTIFALAARRGLFVGRAFFDDSANIV